MLNELRTFFDHSRHKLKVRNVDALLDILAFQGSEGLSQLFNYRVEFTCLDGDIAAETMLGQDASFSLYGAPQSLPMIGVSMPATAGLGEKNARTLRALDRINRKRVWLRERGAYRCRG